MSKSKLIKTDYLILGSGLSGLTIANILSKNGLKNILVDKGRKSGGRMANGVMNRHEIGGNDFKYDHGAQFFTVRSDEFKKVVDIWLKNKWIKKTDIKKINHKEKNFVKIFKKFINVKYVWGGKTFQGIDCSALLQIFFCFNNSFYPRDTKDQIKYTKKNSKKRKFKKGDIIFWKGHVAMCLNSKQLIHAYGPERKVIIMPIIETINRIEKTAKLKVKKVSRIKY